MTPEHIKAIGGLWPLVLIVLVGIFAIVYKEQLKRFIDRLSVVRLKRGSTEFELAGELQQTATKPELSQGETPSPGPPAKDAGEDLAKSLPESLSDLLDEMAKSHQARDMQRLEKVFERIQDSETDAVEKLRHKIVYLYWRYDLGDTSAIEQLVTLSQCDEVSSDANFWIGYAYATAGDYLKAAEAYEASAKKIDDVKEKVKRVVAAAMSLFEAQRRSEAFDRLELELSKVSDSSAQSLLYRGLASLHKRSESSDLQAIALAKAIEATPNDASLHFDAGYAYSAARLEELGLLHYKRQLRFDPKNASALNNEGVQYERLKIPGLSVKAYKQAIELNETLSAANLAYMYVNAGNMEEARRILEAARAQPKVHPNVGSAIAALAEREAAESKAEEAALELARKQQAFLVSFAAAYFVASKPLSLGGVWKSDGGLELTLSAHDARLEAVWVQGGKKFRFEGTLRNRGAAVTFSAMRYAFITNTEMGFQANGQGYAYLSPDDQQLLVMRVKEEIAFFTLRRPA
jgi:Flp pilus assembly protein TadD